MMAITPADRKNYDERLRQTREEYEERESETVRRKNKEIKRAEQRHQEEVKKLTEAYNEKLESVQNHNRETLSERDRKHNDDVEEVRSMFMGQIRKQAEDAALEKKQIRDTYEFEKEKMEKVTSSQRDNTTEKQANELAKRDERIAQLVQDSKEKMQETITKNRNKIEGVHEKEVGALKKQIQDSEDRAEWEKKQLRKAYSNEVNMEKRQKEHENSAWSQRYQEVVEGMKETHAEDIKSRMEIMEAERQRLEDRYQNALENKADQMSEANEDFRDSLSERINSQVRSKQHQLNVLNDKLNNEIVNNNRRRSIERKALEDAYGKKWDDLYRQKEEVKENYKTLAQDRVNNVIHRNDDTLRRANRDHRSELALIHARNIQDRAASETAHNDQLRVVKEGVDNRVKQIQKMANEINRVNGDYYGESVEQLRQGFQEKVSAQRDEHIATQSEFVNNMTERFRDMERKYNNKIESLTSNYEEKIRMLTESNEKALKRNTQTAENLLKDREKGHKLEQESLKQKYEAKLSMKEEEHENEKERLSRKHEEDIRAIASRMNSYSRKA